MTRVILTNKQTGQELPEAELVYESSTAWDIQFDGAAYRNIFRIEEWDVREVHTFRNGDVLRRKDRDSAYVRYVYVVKMYEPSGRWLEVDSYGSVSHHANPAALNNPDWELV